MVGGALTPFSVQTLLISRQRATSCRARSDPAGSGSRGSAPAHVCAQPRKVTEHMVRGREPGELRLADGPALVVSPKTQPPRSLVDTVIARSDPGPQVLWRIPRLALCVRYPHRLTRHLSPLKRIPKLQPRAYIQVPVETLSHHHHSYRLSSPAATRSVVAHCPSTTRIHIPHRIVVRPRIYIPSASRSVSASRRCPYVLRLHLSRLLICRARCCSPMFIRAAFSPCSSRYPTASSPKSKCCFRSPSIKRRPASVESAPPPPCQLHAPLSRPIHDVT